MTARKHIDPLAVWLLVLCLCVVGFVVVLVILFITQAQLDSMRYDGLAAHSGQWEALEKRTSTLEGIGNVVLVIGGISLLWSLIFGAQQTWSDTKESRKKALQSGAKTVKAIGTAVNKKPVTTYASASRADELRKWDQLRKDGLVTQEEFDQFRKELMGK